MRGLAVFDATIFLAAALLHLGGRFAIGPVVLVIGRIFPATVVEGVIGIFFLVTACALFTRATWAGSVALVAHLFALAGVLVGLVAITAGSKPYESLNVGYHAVMLAAIIAGLILQFGSGTHLDRHVVAKSTGPLS
jgi:hypothetical protein